MIRSKMGRPPLSENEKTEKRSMSLTASMYAFLQAQGGGIASKGLQKLVAEAMRRQKTNTEEGQDEG